MLKRRLNPFLLASTVLVLSLLAGLAVLWQGQLSELVSDKKNLSTEIEEKNQKISSLQAEKSNLSEETSTLKDAVKQLKGLNSQLNATIKERDAKISSLESIVDDKDEEIEGLEDTNEELRENVSDIEEDFLTVCKAEEDSGNITDIGSTFCDRQFGEEFE